MSNIQTTFQLFHRKVASYSKSKSKKVNKTEDKRRENNRKWSSKYKIRDYKKIHLITKRQHFDVL